MLNDMCKNCLAFHAGGCAGDHGTVYNGCVLKSLADPEIKTEYQTFKLVLMIPGFLYYADETESDENANTIVISAENGEILSDNYFAYNAIFEDLEKIHKGEIIDFWMSEIMKECFKLMQEAGDFED